jgi:hypothetical protein
MTDKKTISINPELFKISNNKTKKQKTTIPTISSSLKNKFLKKVANSKNEKLKNKKLFVQDPLENNEFEKSIQFISDLIHDEKKENLYNKSIKQPTEQPIIPVMTELSMELQEEIIPEPISNSTISLNYKIDNEVGYGCLKNGLKPNYRTWIKTKKNNCLEENTKPIKQTFIQNTPSLLEEIPLQELPIHKKQIIQKEVVSIPKEQTIKKTIKKTYTLGKSKMYRKIGLLLKNKTIKQKVLDAQKELKKTDIKSIKKYLVDKGLIKIGSNAPVDVLKELYENAKLTGEVNNSNKETLLYNFINEKE